MKRLLISLLLLASLVLLPRSGGDALAWSDLDVGAWLGQPGVRLLAVEFYASWCKPCREAVPRWKELHSRYADKGLRIVIITLSEEGACASPEWAPDAVICDDTGRLQKAWHAGQLPQAFLWSWQGNLRISHGSAEEVQDTIEAWFQDPPRVLVLDPVDGTGASLNDKAIGQSVRKELVSRGHLELAEGDEAKEIRKLYAAADTGAALVCQADDLPGRLVLSVVYTGSDLSLQLMPAGRRCILATATGAVADKTSGVRGVVRSLLAGLRKSSADRPRDPKAVKVEGPEAPIGKDPGTWTPPAAETPVIVGFRSRPEGAAVIVDGRLICESTADGCSRTLPRGRHSVTLQMDGYETISKTMDLKKKTDINWTLKPTHGWLTVKTQPPGQEITLDGTPMGSAPLEGYMVEPGSHEIRVEDPCSFPRTKRIKVQKGRTVSVTVKAPPRVGAVRVIPTDVNGNVLQADVYAVGKKIGRAPGTFKVPVCATEIELKGRGVRWKGTVEVPEREVIEVHPILKPVGENSVFIPKGWFHMGCNEKADRACKPEEKPMHRVWVDDFLIERHEVTIRQYKACVDAGACSRPKNVRESELCNWGVPGREKHPVNCLTWPQAKSYCKWKKGRLPTEAEWEKAARGARDKRVYPWGNQRPSCDLVIFGDNRGIDGCGRKSSWPVCSKPKGNSPYGLCDMSGNVSEWVQDVLDSDWYRNSPDRNPVNTSRGSRRVVKGGTWYLDADHFLRISRRASLHPLDWKFNRGVRCVYEP